MKALEIHNSGPTLYWEDSTSCISMVEDEIVTPRVKHIDIPIFFLQEQFDNGIFVPKYDKSIVITEDMCTQ